MRAVPVRVERWHPEPRLASLRAGGIDRVAPEPRVALHDRHPRDSVTKLRPRAEAPLVRRASRAASNARPTTVSAAGWGRPRG
jgi:hypothetical protein